MENEFFSFVKIVLRISEEKIEFMENEFFSFVKIVLRISEEKIRND